MDTAVYILSEKNTGSYCIPHRKSINIQEEDFLLLLLFGNREVYTFP